jgi:rfaE bifunctional protein nucleotidyltransferase chain/domain
MDTTFKIKTLAEIAKAVDPFKKKGLKVVHCHGEFDLLHFGHTRYFKAARKFGDLLIVTLTPDRFIMKGPGRPVFNEDQRAEAIANLEFVDYVGINEKADGEHVIRIIKPDIYVKGSEYIEKKDVTGRLEVEKKMIESLGGEMKFTHEAIFSSSKLLNNHFNVFPKESKPFLDKLSNEYDAMDILAFIDRLKEMKILLIGEPRIDEHIMCSPDKENPSQKIVVDTFSMPKGLLTGISILKHYCENLTILPIPLIDQEGDYNPCMISSIEEEELAASTKPNCTHYWDSQTNFNLFNVTSKIVNCNKHELENKLLILLESKIDDFDSVLLFDHGSITNKIKNFLANQKLFLALIIQEQNAMNELYQYSNIDFLCLPEGLNKNLHQTDQILRTAQSEILVVSDSECRWRHNEYSQIPRFSNKLDNSLGYDLPSLLLSILAPLRAIKINPEWLELIGNALITLLAEKNRSIDIFDKTVFEKFIIALLNR